jgi:hypothetical protein
MDGLELNAWYLDDGTVGGRTMTVRRFVDSLRQVSSEHGLQLNMAKCELVCADSEVDRMRLLWPDLEKVVPVSKFFLLGTPLGSDEEAQAHLRKVAEKSIRRANLTTRLGDPVVASALLRYTTGFCIGNFCARSVGGLGRTVFSTIDEATLNAWETINFPFETPELRALACLPTSFGGIGLREQFLRTTQEGEDRVARAPINKNENIRRTRSRIRNKHNKTRWALCRYHPETPYE